MVSLTPVPFSKLFPPPVWGVIGTWEVWGWAYSIAHPWVPISSPFTHIFYLLSFLSYLAGSKSVSVQPRYDANTDLEATASSSGKNKVRIFFS